MKTFYELCNELWNMGTRKNSIRNMIESLALYEWGSGNLHQIRQKPDTLRIKCPGCRHEQALLPHKIYPDDTGSCLDVLMSMCRCGRVNFWIGWPDDWEERQAEALQNICDQSLESLK